MQGQPDTPVDIGESDILLLQLGIRTTGIHIRIKRSLDMERSLSPSFGETVRRRDAVISEITFPGICETLAVVGTEVQSTALFESETFSDIRQLGIRVGLCLEFPRRLARLCLDDHDAGSEVTVFCGRNNGNHFDRFHGTGADGPQVDASARRGLITHPIALHAGRCAETG